MLGTLIEVEETICVTYKHFEICKNPFFGLMYVVVERSLGTRAKFFEVNVNFITMY